MHQRRYDREDRHKPRENPRFQDARLDRKTAQRVHGNFPLEGPLRTSTTCGRGSPFLQKKNAGRKTMRLHLLSVLNLPARVYG